MKTVANREQKCYIRNTELDKAPDTQAPAIFIRFLCFIFFACIAGKGASFP